MRILLVEDEISLQTINAKRLAQEGYSVDVASDGEEAEEFLRMGSYDCIILDIMLPYKDGLTLLREMRSRQDSAPVLLLTAKDSVEDRVKGLDAGADDYLVKPFSYDELSARVRAMLRRGVETKSVTLQFEDLQMDTLSRQVRRGEEYIELTAKEYALLEYFLRNPRKVLTRGQIIEHIWNFDFDSDSNIVDVYVRYLRRKVDYGFDKKLIHTVRGVGYVLREDNDQ